MSNRSSKLARVDGSLSYDGREVRMSASGEPCVFTFDGWMNVSAFESTGGTIDDIDNAMSIASFSPQGAMANAYAKGPA